MDIRDDCIVHPAPWETRELDKWRLQRIAQAQRYLDEGLLTPDKILERLTDSLTYSLHGTQLIPGLSLDAIHRRFLELMDPQSEGITKDSFIAGVSSSIPAAAASDDRVASLRALFDLTSWHASFPFVAAAAAAAVVDEPGLIRALAHLSPREAGPRWTLAPHAHYDVRQGHWGPDARGWIVTARHASAEDWRRRVFRALAVPIPAAAAAAAAEATTAETLPIPRFLMFQPRGEGDEGGPSQVDEEDEDEGRQVAVVHDEDERTADLLDVLALTSPNDEPMSGKPFRESYDGAILQGLVEAAMPQPLRRLSELAVPKRKLGSLLSLLLVAPPSGKGEGETASPTGGLQAGGDLVQELLASGDGELLNVEKFDEVLKKCQVEVQAGLDKLFDVLFG